MLVQGLVRRRADLVVSASSPPCLVVVAAAVAARHRAKSIHWVMDLYPEIASALGELRFDWVAAGIKKLTGWAYRRCDQVIGLDSDMVERLGEYGVKAKSIRPWVVEPAARNRTGPKAPKAPEEWVWIYSGNLGRGHEWRPLLQAQSILEQRGANVCLTFQGGGPMWPEARREADRLGLKRCKWKPYVPQEELEASLLGANCCVVSQKPAVRGLLWPSKLSLLLTLPRPLLWIGPADGAIASELKTLPWAGVFSPGQELEIAEWILAASANQEFTAIEPLHKAEEHRATALQAWSALVEATLQSQLN